MSQFDRLDLVVSDVPTAAALFHDAVGLALRANEPRYAELDSGAVVLLAPTLTDWGAEMALIGGPDDLVVSVYRPADGGGLD